MAWLSSWTVWKCVARHGNLKSPCLGSQAWLAQKLRPDYWAASLPDKCPLWEKVHCGHSYISVDWLNEWMNEWNEKILSACTLVVVYSLWDAFTILVLNVLWTWRSCSPSFVHLVQHWASGYSVYLWDALNLPPRPKLISISYGWTMASSPVLLVSDCTDTLGLLSWDTT